MTTTTLMTKSEAERRIAEDPDFVNLKRYGYSLAAVLEAFPNGCPDKLIAQALLVTEDDVPAMEDVITTKLRRSMKVNLDV